MHIARERITGWGRTTTEVLTAARPATRDEIGAALERLGTPAIARGLGRSYGDAAQAPGGVVITEGLDHLISFDPATGILETETGISLGELIDLFVPRGWMPPVIPGTRHVTVGGAIASDIHGKNHHRDGSFGTHVLGFELLLPTGEHRTVTPTDGSLFAATVGGMGLTGVIVAARLQMTAVETSYVSTVYERTRDLDGTLAALTARDDEHKYSVAWIDTLAGGSQMGRAVCMWGDPLSFAELPPRLKPLARSSLPGPRMTVPIDAPGWLLGPLSVRLFNDAYYRTHGSHDARPAHIAPFFFPLDAVTRWNRMYGPRGFYQHQTVVPAGERSLVAIHRMLEVLANARVPGFLAVLKRLGDWRGGPLSFPMPGWTLAVDIPARGEHVNEVARSLDRLALEAGGRVYLTKDALLDPSTFRAMYPRAAEIDLVRETIDPTGRMGSRLSTRVGLTEGRA